MGSQVLCTISIRRREPRHGRWEMLGPGGVARGAAVGAGLGEAEVSGHWKDVWGTKGGAWRGLG